MEKKFKVGDRVKVRTDSIERGLYGASGTIIHDDNNPPANYLVEFDETRRWLHSGHGLGKDNRCWWLDDYDLEKIETPIKPQFKVGDRVIVNGFRDGKYFEDAVGKVVDVNGYTNIGIEFNNNIDGHSCGGEGKMKHCWWVNKSMCKLYQDEKIIIYRDGNKVIAKNTVTKKTAEAKCHEDDTFDFAIGAKLAFERLVEEPKPKFKVGDKVRIREWDDMTNEFETTQNKLAIELPDTKFTKHMKHLCGRVATITEVEVLKYHTRVRLKFEDRSGDTSWYFTNDMIEHITDEEFEAGKPKKLYNGKVVCVDNTANTNSLTIGKIYEFVDGRFIDNNGEHRPYYSKRVESLDDFHKCGCSARFIEVIE